MEEDHDVVRGPSALQNCAGSNLVSGGGSCRDVARSQRGGAKQIWSTEDRHSRCGLQVEEHRFPGRQGPGAEWDQGHGRQDSWYQEHLAENAAESDSRLRRRLCHRIRQPGSGGGLRRESQARSVAKALGRTSREQLVVPGVKSLALDRPMREAYRGSRTIPSLRRTKASTAPSDKIRLPHFTTVASGVTPYRGLGCGASIARRITRAQSSGVVFDFARESLALAMNCA